MKKSLLTIVAVLAAMAGFAQDNLAQGKDAIATTGDAAAAVDGNTGTRWESAQEDNQTWQVDLGTAQEFNTIQIVWEGAYTKTYTIEAGDNVDGDGWLTGGTVIASGVNNAMPNTQTIKLDAPVTARYIKYNAIDRGTPWGNSFWEFRVFNAADPVLTSIDLTASAAYASIGSAVTLTAAGKDQLGSPFETGTVTYTVEPADAGTVSGNIYTPTQAGSATITASVGDIQSNAVTVTAYDGEKIDLFTDWATRVEALGEDTKEDSKVGAFDANINSLWELYGNSEERNYETGFIVDLQANYDITAISVMFEGACSRDYQISFAGSNKEFGAPAFTWAGPEGVMFRTDFWTEGDAANSTKGVRYVKFLSTRAATQYGVKIYDFSVYGKSSELDATVPAISEVSAEATGDNSIAVYATGVDESEGNISFEFTLGSETITASAASGTQAEAEFTGLKPGKEYTITVVAINEVGVKSEPATVTAITTGEPDPNLWAGAQITPNVYFAPNWAANDNYSVDINETTATITTNEATPAIDNGIWQAQFFFLTDIATSKDNTYDFKATFTADKDINATIKLYQRPEEGGSNDIFYFTEDIQLKAGEAFTLPKSDKFIAMKGIDMQNVGLLVAFGGNPAVTINVEDIVLKVNDGEQPEQPETNAISSVNTENASHNEASYNLAGQRVGSQYRGIVIQNGKKMIRK